MENGVVMTIDEKARVDALIRKCFPDVEDFEHSASYSLTFLSNKKSFWSKIARVFLHWKDDKLSAKYPRSVFIKIPHISDNVKGTDKSENYSDGSDAEALLKLTQYEVLWYERYGNDSIPNFPFPKFYAAESVTEPGTGIIAMEDLSERVKAMDLIPGFSYEQVERLMDALAGFHYHFISKKDQSWATEFNRVAEIEPEFQDLQYETALKFESICPEKFAGRIRAMEEHFSVEAGFNAHYSYKELDVPPVLVHFDLNPSNILWSSKSANPNELVAIIDFQLLHTGNFAEDIVRVLILSLSRHDRCMMTERFLKRYHDTLTRLSNGKPPFTLDKVYEAYDRIFLYACNFALFGLSIYHDMCEDLEKDEVRRVKFQNELIDRAYGVVIDAERLLFSQST
uniref:CHK domain-containing protein n=1 Tax=Haemonchus contortus TaxID=6289 RepID=A0A7I4Z745_HAECO